jgi:hypothetical protein
LNFSICDVLLNSGKVLFLGMHECWIMKKKCGTCSS